MKKIAVKEHFSLYSLIFYYFNKYDIISSNIQFLINDETENLINKCLN